MFDERCMKRVTAGATVGAAVGGAVGASTQVHTHTPTCALTARLLPLRFFARCTGAVYGTYEAFRFKVPGLLKVRYIGKTTTSSAAVFGLFLAAGSLLQCGRRR